MATKVTILGMDEPKEKELKKIEFVTVLEYNGKLKDANNNPHLWANIELVCKRNNNELDVMFVYDENRSNGFIVLGHFNDGIV